MSNSIPPFNGFLPPLPPGWTEHTAPGGQPYYYHAATNQSTYVRPMSVSGINPNAVIPGALPKKKEKPVAKTPIPGTQWLRVKTTEGNIFYTQKERKESVWEVPEEIKEQVAQLELEEKEREQQEAENKIRQEEEARRQAEEDQRLEEQEEIERIKQEVQSAVSHGKRKASESTEESKPFKRKKSLVETPEEADIGHISGDDGQRNIAEETLHETELNHVSESKNSKPTFTVPNKVDLSTDEAKALFKTLLKDKEINPLHPWDKSLPLFISDPRYVLLPSVTARREAFDEYCRDIIRAQRAAKAASLKEEASGIGETDKDIYHQLLREEVSSTRTLWSDFRRKWKKDRRFYGWTGDKEREKAFKDWIKNLASMKKKQAEKAERDFFQLLKEHQYINPSDEWKIVKQSINARDPRYDAVGSSSLREELFNVYVKTLTQSPPLNLQNSDPKDQSQSIGPNDEEDRATRAQRALQEREQKVRRDKESIERLLDRTRGVLGREEGELEFGTLLTDAIREPVLTWDEALSQLSGDPRFDHCALPPLAQKELFDKHVGHLRDRYIKNLHALFAAHAPRLNLNWADIDSSARKTISRSLPASKLKLVTSDDDGDEDLDSDDEEAMRKHRNRHKDAQLEMEFDRWKRQRNVDARKAFDNMLNENAFLEFWGRMGKAGGEGVGGGVKPEDEEDEEEEGEGGGGKADMKQLAKQIDEDEFGRVLKNDARWVAFDDMPEERIKWLRNHVEQLSAPKLSVHVPDKHTTSLRTKFPQ